MGRTIADVAGAVRRVAPEHLAEEWDNVGLLLGDPGWEASGPVLLAIDLTPAVAREALAMGASAVAAYHPPIFTAIKRLTASDPRSSGLVGLMRAGIAVYSPHTALDAAPGGVADWLADVAAGDAAIVERAALEPVRAHEGGGSHKIVVFVPAEDADGLRAAMSDAGAGVIGAYTRCSFGLEGVGTFLGDDSTNPAVGERGRLETVRELRVEMVCPEAALPAALDAMRRAHPYEEPAFDVYRREASADARVGAGRAATLGSAVTADEVAANLRAALGAPVRLATPTAIGVDAAREIRVIGSCPGAGASLADAAIAVGAGLFVTGEMRHHEVLAALEKGCAVALAGHTNTERGYLPVLAEKLRGDLGDVRVSEADRWPFDEIG